MIILTIKGGTIIYESENGSVAKEGPVEFAHPELGVEVKAIGGHYLFTREETLDHPAGQVLYLVGYAVTDRSCCGPAGCIYAVVTGRIVSLRFCMREDGRPVSIIDPIEESLYEDLAKAIRLKEGVSQVHFLCENGGSRVMF
jgi:hypothetical protein